MTGETWLANPVNHHPEIPNIRHQFLSQYGKRTRQMTSIFFDSDKTQAPIDPLNPR
jgi:hypothetical protein